MPADTATDYYQVVVKFVRRGGGGGGGGGGAGRRAERRAKRSAERRAALHTEEAGGVVGDAEGWGHKARVTTLGGGGEVEARDHG